jgi:hypothetical protein
LVLANCLLISSFLFFFFTEKAFKTKAVTLSTLLIWCLGNVYEVFWFS